MDRLQISFRNLDTSVSAEEQVRQRAAELVQANPHITSCRVVVELGRHGHEPGSRFHVHLVVLLPGGEIVVREARDELHAAIREAFHDARRRVQEHAHRHESR